MLHCAMAWVTDFQVGTFLSNRRSSVKNSSIRAVGYGMTNPCKGPGTSCEKTGDSTFGDGVAGSLKSWNKEETHAISYHFQISNIEQYADA